MIRELSQIKDPLLKSNLTQYFGSNRNKDENWSDCFNISARFCYEYPTLQLKYVEGSIDKESVDHAVIEYAGELCDLKSIYVLGGYTSYIPKDIDKYKSDDYEFKSKFRIGSTDPDFIDYIESNIDRYNTINISAANPISNSIAKSETRLYASRYNSRDTEEVEVSLNEYLKNKDNEWFKENKSKLVDWFTKDDYANLKYAFLIAPGIIAAAPALFGALVAAKAIQYGFPRFIDRYKERKQYFKNLESDYYVFVVGIPSEDISSKRSRYSYDDDEGTDRTKILSYGPYNKSDADSKHAEIIKKFKSVSSSKVIEGKFRLNDEIHAWTGVDPKDKGVGDAEEYKVSKTGGSFAKAKPIDLEYNKSEIEKTLMENRGRMDPKTLEGTEIPLPTNINKTNQVYDYAIDVATAIHGPKGKNNYNPKLAEDWAERAEKVAIEANDVGAGINYILGSVRR